MLALLGAAHEVHPYLRTLIGLARRTERRLSAVLGLRWDNVDLADGRIRWRVETDKLRRTSVIPVSRAVLAELSRFRALQPGVGRALLFPHPPAIAEVGA